MLSLTLSNVPLLHYDLCGWDYGPDIIKGLESVQLVSYQMASPESIVSTGDGTIPYKKKLLIL